jgi:hypothetical protein
MAYDLVVGRGSKVKDAAHIVGGIEFGELPAILRLLERVDSSFVRRISNLFEDQAFSVAEIEQVLPQLLPLLTLNLRPDEEALLHKLISVLSCAKWKQLGLYGIAD